MKKYTLTGYKDFCKNAFVMPPAENFEEWINSHSICITANGCEMELDYSPDVIEEFEYALQELYKIYFAKRLKYLPDSVDYEELKANLDEWSLQHIEKKIAEYEEADKDEYNEKYPDFPNAVAWWEGCIDTEDLIDYYKNL